MADNGHEKNDPSNAWILIILFLLAIIIAFFVFGSNALFGIIE